MGIWNQDIICCDSTLEIAMEMLCKAGIGPPNYPSKSNTVVFSRFKVDGTDCNFIGRYTPERYSQFFRCLENAQHSCAVLEDYQVQTELFRIAMDKPNIYDTAPGGQSLSGNAFHIFGLIYMAAGCEMHESLRAILLDHLDTDAWAKNPMARERRSVIRHFRGLVQEYDFSGRKAIYYRSMHPFEYFELNAMGRTCGSQAFIESIASRVSRRHVTTNPYTGKRVLVKMKRLGRKLNEGEILDRNSSEVASLFAGMGLGLDGGEFGGEDPIAFLTTSKNNQPPKGTQVPYVPPSKLNSRVSKSSKKIARNIAKDDTFTQSACQLCGTWQVGDNAKLKLKKCSGCRVTFYCSLKCQKEDWSTHGKLCKKLSKKKKKKKIKK